MKAIPAIIISFILLSTVSCVINIDSVNGNGEVISKERHIGEFDRLRVSSGIDVIMKQGDHVSLLLEADENLHDIIKTDIIDNTLKIHSEQNIGRAKAKTVYLIYTDLSSIRVSSAGDVKGENTLRTDRIDIDLSSAGDLKLDLEAEEVIVDISSSGDARITGKTDLLKADLSSAGDLHAFELISRKCKVSCSSAGDARINATEELELRSSSAGSIYYKGDAKIISSRTSSAGSIIKK